MFQIGSGISLGGFVKDRLTGNRETSLAKIKKGVGVNEYPKSGWIAIIESKEVIVRSIYLCKG